MGIETSMYNNLLRPPKSVAEYDAEAMQSQQNKLALQMQQMQMAGQQRGIEQENALAGAYKTAVGVDGAMDRNKLYAAVAQAGGGAKLPSIQKAYADQDKVAADADKTKGETKKAAREDAEHQFELAGQLAGAWANNPAVTKQQIQSGLTAAIRAGMINDEIGNAKLAELAAVGDDAPSLNGWANRTLMQVMKAKDQFALTTVDANTKERSRVDTENSLRSAASSKYSADSSANSAAAGRAQSERASIRSDERARDFNATRSEEVKAKTAIGKAPTEFQGKSAAFGARADQADKIITSLEGKYRPGAIATKQALGKAWVIGGALEAGGNMLIGENEQKAEQAQRDFINAVLRQESGAAIGESEFENAKRQYFAATGDTEATLRQKAENRRLAVKGFKSNAGRAQFDTDAAAPTVNALPAGWSVEAN